MTYIEIEKKIISIMDYFPPEVRKSGDYDIPFLVLEIVEPYELIHTEIGGIYEELCRIFSGKTDTNLLTKRIKERLNDDRKDSANKIVDELQTKVISPIIKILGDKFPIDMPDDENDAQYKVIEGESIDRESILSGIENPTKNSSDANMRMNTNYTNKEMDLEIRPEMIPEKIYPEIQKIEKELPKPQEKPKVVGSIIEQKMSGMTSLPRKETILRPQPSAPKPITKSYEKDPYREALK